MAWRGQSARARSIQVGLPILLATLVVVMAAWPAVPVSHVQAAVHQEQPSPDPSASPSPNASPSPDNGPPVETIVTSGRSYHAAGCGTIPVPGALYASWYPRVVIPSVGINVEIHPGDGGTPPDNQWVAWLYPGLSHPGETGNSYVYAHAHGQPQGSAPGLFWPLHYMHPCDAVYVYTSATNVIRYQTVTVDRQHSGRDMSPLDQTTDERITMQTCNDWNPDGPKTIVVAERFLDAPPPAQSGSGGAPPPSGGGGGGAPAPQPSPSPTPKPVITIPPLP